MVLLGAQQQHCGAVGLCLLDGGGLCGGACGADDSSADVGMGHLLVILHSGVLLPVCLRVEAGLRQQAATREPPPRTLRGPVGSVLLCDGIPKLPAWYHQAALDLRSVAPLRGSEFGAV